MPVYKYNGDLHFIEIFFEEVPSGDMRRELKNNGWRWNPDKMCWWHKDTIEAESFARELCQNSAFSAPKKQQETLDSFGFFSGDCGKKAKWVISPDGELLILGLGEIQGYSYEMRDRSPWFAYRDRIRKIRIEGCITLVGKRAFYEFYNLESVEMTDSVKTIEDRAFAYCPKLKSISLSKNLIKIGSQAFRDCNSIAELNLPEGISDIASDAFKNWLPTQKVYVIRHDVRNGKPYKEIFCIPRSDKSAVVFFEDFVAISNTNWCINQGHEIEKVQAIFFLLLRDGTIKEMTVPAGYCKQCRKYLIGQWQYEKMRNIGVLLCQIVQELPTQKKSSSSYYAGLSPESILRQSGYTVSANENLSDEQRQNILICLVESELCSKFKICSHLSWLIQSREGRMEFQNAVSKWSADRDFIDGYQIGSCRMAAVRSLKVRR